MKFILFILGFLSCGLNAYAGGNESHGGLSIVCRAPDNNAIIRSVELFDLWEARRQHWQTDEGAFLLTIPEIDTSVEEQITTAMSRLTSADKIFAQAVAKELAHIQKNFYPTAADSKLKLVETLDSKHYIDTNGSDCNTEQLINYRADKLVIYDKKLWQALKTKNTHIAAAYLHEAIYALLRKAPYEVKDSRLARKINGFTFSDLDFTEKDFPAAWQQLVAPKLAAQITENINTVKWVDASTGPDGEDLGACDNAQDQCVLMDQKSKLYWTSVNATPSDGLPFDWNEHDDYYIGMATRSCSSLNNWGGYQNWRLPTVDELLNAHHHDITSLSEKFSGFGDSDNYFWSRDIDFSAAGKHYAVNLESGDNRTVGVNSQRVKWRCVRSTADGDWHDLSWDPIKKARTSCHKLKDHCILHHIPSKFMFSEKMPATNFIPEHDTPNRRAVVNREDAFVICNSLKTKRWGGYDDWRVPTRQELGRAEYYGFLGASRSYQLFGNLYLGGFITSDTETIVNGNTRTTMSFKFHIGKSGWSTAKLKVERDGSTVEDHSKDASNDGAAICVRGLGYE